MELHVLYFIGDRTLRAIRPLGARGRAGQNRVGRLRLFEPEPDDALLHLVLAPAHVRPLRRGVRRDGREPRRSTSQRFATAIHRDAFRTRTTQTAREFPLHRHAGKKSRTLI